MACNMDSFTLLTKTVAVFVKTIRKPINTMRGQYAEFWTLKQLVDMIVTVL
jgi:hypothetical protein